MKLVCKEPLSDDIDREWVGISEKDFRTLGLSEHDYVQLTGNVSQFKTRVKELSELEEGSIRIRASHRTEIGASLGETIEVERIGPDHLELNVHYGLAEDTGEYVCRMHPSAQKQIGVGSGDKVELFNLDTKSRLVLKVKSLTETESNDRLRVDMPIRELLNLNIGESVGVRKSVIDIPKRGLLERLMGWLVGVNFGRFVVDRGLDTDEGKGVVRLRKDNMSLLGVEEGDKVDVFGYNNFLDLRVQEAPADSTSEDEFSDLGFKIMVCSNERTQLNLDLLDSVKVTRSASHVLNKNFDRVIASCVTFIGVFAELKYYLDVPFIQSLVVSILLFFLTLWSLFMKTRSQV